MAEPNDYITATRKNFVSNDNEGRMVEKCIVEIQGTFLVKIRDYAFNGNVGENALSVFPVSLAGAASEWFTKECLGSITTWDNMVKKFILKFHHLSDHNEEEETEEDDNQNKTDNILKSSDHRNLFNFEGTCLCEAFNEFNYLIKIDTDLFTNNVQNLKTYDEYELELNNDIARGPEEPWLENGVPYQLYIDGFSNGGKLPGMVRVRSMTYFQNHKWYDELVDGKLKEETLALKAKVKGSWGDAAPGIAPFTGMENFGRGLYANMKTEKTRDLYLDINRIFDRNYEASNVGDTQENQGHEEHKDNPTPEPSNYKIRRFEMMKYSFNDDEEYITLKESEYLKLKG
ncbi:hypothetical protein Tco_1196384 [Tanacetum coccineum]